MIIQFRTVLFTTTSLPIGKEGDRVVDCYTRSLAHEIFSLVIEYLELLLLGVFRLHSSMVFTPTIVTGYH